MKKIKTFICAVALLGTSATALIGCDNKGGQTQTFTFSAELASGKSFMEITGEGSCTDSVKIVTDDKGKHNYVYTSRNDTVTVDQNGNIVANQAGTAVIKIEDTVTGETYSFQFQVIVGGDPATGGFNYSAASGEGAVERRTEILGKLEKYAIDSHLTGITLFENGGYVKYSKRISIPATKYITGYGWGILSEGSITGNLKGDTTGAYKSYYHSAQTSNTWDVNAWNASGSQISDLSGYITSSYWSTKMTSSKDAYAWYPLLAADTVDGKTNDRPIHVGEDNALGLYRKWRIYVKTYENMGGESNPKALKFRSKNPAGNNIPVTLDDYEFAYRMILTGSNKQSRGAEMAGDKTYGIKGAQAFYNKTKKATDQQAKDTWDAMKADGSLGFAVGKDTKGDYVELEILNDIDAFTAMYTLSSNLVSPMHEDFIKSIGNGTIADGLVNYGKVGNSSIPENVICLGAYYLDVWDKDNVVFTRNNDWFEVSAKRYLIDGVKITNYDAATQDTLYEYFQSGLLDSCGIPIKQISKEMGNSDEMGTTLKTEGDSTFKLNVNSCTQEQWDKLDDKLWHNNGQQDEKWGGIKPWMSNKSFLDGLYWSIDRETFAKNRGVNPSINYFANAYLSDPENGISYNSTAAHAEAVEKYHGETPYQDPQTGEIKNKDNYGYSYTKAVESFKTAVAQLSNNGGLTLGTKEKPTEINVHIRWMYVTDVTDYGTEIATYFEKAFNDEAVSGGKVKLVVKQDAVTNWEDVYNKYMMKGQFDLAFGAISGNTYNPLNFLEVLKSDNSSTFTLNWGTDTSIVDPLNPLIYDGKKWSFDALWEVADRGGIVKDGEITKTVQNYYISDVFGNLENGGDVLCQLDFAKVEGAEISIDKVEIYNMAASENVKASSYIYDDESGALLITISKELGKSIANEMRRVINREDTTSPVDPNDSLYVADPFQRKFYNAYFTFEVYFSLSINGGNPSQSMVTIALTQEDQA